MFSWQMLKTSNEKVEQLCCRDVLLSALHFYFLLHFQPELMAESFSFK